MKTDRFMQGILVSDEDELFSYPYHKPNHGLSNVVRRLKQLKKNLKNLKYYTNHSFDATKNNHAVFSKTTVDGSIDDAIADVWVRLSIKHNDTSAEE